MVRTYIHIYIYVYVYIYTYMYIYIALYTITEQESKNPRILTEHAKIMRKTRKESWLTEQKMFDISYRAPNPLTLGAHQLTRRWPCSLRHDGGHGDCDGKQIWCPFHLTWKPTCQVWCIREWTSKFNVATLLSWCSLWLSHCCRWWWRGINFRIERMNPTVWLCFSAPFPESLSFHLTKTCPFWKHPRDQTI